MPRKKGIFSTPDNKKKLKELLDNFTEITDIRNEFGVSKNTLTTELKKGLTPEDYKKRSYQNYDPELALEHDTKDRSKDYGEK